MKKRIGKIFLKIAFPLLLLSTLSSCWNARDINELFIAVGIGIDKADTAGNVLLTTQIVKPGDIKKPSKESSGSEGQAYWNLKSSAPTVFSAFREFTHTSSNKMYLSHAQTIVIGKDAAEDGVRKYLDFFIRSHETRPTTIILVSASTAGKVLDIKPQLEKLPAMKMAKLAKEQELLTAHAMSVNLQDFTVRLLSKTTSPVAPMVTIVEEDKEKLLHVEEMAVFKGDKMAGTLNDIETRGLLWVLGKVKGSAIDVDLPDGKVSVEITKAESKVTPQLRNGQPYIRVTIKAEGNLANQAGEENVATIQGFPSLGQLQNEIIRSEIELAIKKARELDTDVFGFGDLFHKKYRKEWKLMEKNWDELFPELKVEIEVKSAVRAAGLIIKPAVPDIAAGGKK